LTLLQDLRYALRGMALQKGFALIVILCLGTGIGVNATLFSVVDGMLIQPLPYDDPERIVVLRNTQPASNVQSGSFSWPNARDMADAQRTFSTLAFVLFRSVTLADADDPERYRAAAVSWNLFSMLGTRPALGRDFAASDDAAGAAGVVLISDAIWRLRYQSDPGILNRRVLINGLPHDVIGVMPAGFTFPENQQLWVPVMPLVHQNTRTTSALRPYSRLAAGVTLEQANAEVRAITQQLAAQYPESNQGWVGRVITLREEFIPEEVVLVLWLMMGAATLVLFIACSNAANVLLARATARRREISVRAALGAGRGRIVRQLLTESAVFGAVSVPLGLAIAYAGTQLLAAAIPPDEVQHIRWAIDWRSIGYAVVVAAGTTAVFGVMPAVHATRGTLHDDLNDGTRGNTGARSWARDGLVVAQLTLAVVSLVGAALFVRTFINLDDYDIGFDPAPLVTLRVIYSGEEYAPDGAMGRATRDLVERFERLPEVRNVFASNLVPLDGGGSRGRLQIDGLTFEPGREPEVSFVGVTPGFVRTLGLTMVAGENMTESQGWARSEVALVNRTLVTRFFPDGAPVGRRIRVPQGGGDAPWFTIIGVVSDVRHYFNTDEAQAPAVYVPHGWQEAANTGFTISVDDDPSAAGPALRREVRAAAPTIPIFAMQTMDELRRLSFWQFAIFGWVFGLIGAVALLLATVGVFGVLSYAVSQRTREIGVRMALGASHSSIRTLVIRQGLILAGAGVLVGMLAAALVTHNAAALLYNVTPTDPLSFATVGVFLMVMAAVACYMPARRAMRVNPIEALRGE
jgi:predicted permease